MELLFKAPTILAKKFLDICETKKNGTKVINYFKFNENDNRKEFSLEEEDIKILVETFNIIKKNSLTEEIVSVYCLCGSEPSYYNTYLDIVNGELIVSGEDYKGIRHNFNYKDFFKNNKELYITVSERNDISKEWFREILK